MRGMERASWLGLFDHSELLFGVATDAWVVAKATRPDA